LLQGYRDDSLETVKRNRDQYGIPLKILSYQELYGWTMDQVWSYCSISKHHQSCNLIVITFFFSIKIVSQVGRKNNCTFCGVFRRQALDRGAMLLGVNKIVTGLSTNISTVPNHKS